MRAEVADIWNHMLYRKIIMIYFDDSSPFPVTFTTPPFSTLGCILGLTI